MSNLSELLPTGGGQNAVDFVASGTLSSGQTVALKSDGTVEAVAETSVATVVSSATSIGDSPHSSLSQVTVIYDSANTRWFVGWVDGYAYKTRIGTVNSSSSITWGAINSSTSPAGQHGLAYDSTSGFLMHMHWTGAWNVYVGSISGTTISYSGNLWGGRSDITSGTLAFNPSSGRIMAIAVQDYVSNLYYVTCVPIKINGASSVSIGTATTVDSNTTGLGYPRTAYDSVNEQIILAYRLNNSGFKLRAITDTGSGGVSVGSSTDIGNTTQTGDGMTVALSQSAGANLGVVLIAKGGYELLAYTISVSGTTITEQTAPAPVTLTTARNAGGTQTLSYDPRSGTYVAGWMINGSPSFTSYYSILTVTNGTTISASTGTVSGPWSSAAFDIIGDIDTNTYQVFASYQANVGAVKDFEYKLITPAHLASNSADFIGITAEAISNTATGAVNVYGGINEAQTGLTVGSDYYVQDNGTLSTATSTVKVGKAISATTINMMDLT